MKKFFKFGCLGVIALFAIIIIAAVIDLSNDEPKKKEESKVSKEVKQEASWKDKVKEIAAKKATETEKFDEISKYAKGYEPSQEELKSFEKDIIEDFKAKTYISDVSNHEYMLTNIFKSQVVEQSTKEKAMKDFAFDFWQNSKYNYRGAENPTSQATMSNERQMDKALAKMGK